MHFIIFSPFYHASFFRSRAFVFCAKVLSLVAKKEPSLLGRFSSYHSFLDEDKRENVPSRCLGTGDSEEIQLRGLIPSQIQYCLHHTDDDSTRDCHSALIGRTKLHRLWPFPRTGRPTGVPFSDDGDRDELPLKRLARTLRSGSCYQNIKRGTKNGAGVFCGRIACFHFTLGRIWRGLS